MFLRDAYTCQTHMYQAEIHVSEKFIFKIYFIANGTPCNFMKLAPW